MTRIIAVDWSGAATDAHRKIAVAEIAAGALTLHPAELDREGVRDLLIDRARADSDLIVGLDFAFSTPAWFLEQARWSPADLWRKATEGLAESWLMMCEPPFWGRLGRRRPQGGAQFRRTDLAIEAISGIRPKSVFQVGGAGAVGTGSLRGWPILHALREAGFAVWPFDAPRTPMLLEIWPRAFTGSVNKSREGTRVAYLNANCGDLAPDIRAACAESEDAFDAVISARAMWQHRDLLSALPTVEDEELRTEGIIWRPAWRRGEA